MQKADRYNRFPQQFMVATGAFQRLLNKPPSTDTKSIVTDMLFKTVAYTA